MRDHVANGVRQLSRLVMDVAAQRGLTSGRKMEWPSDKRSSPLEEALFPAGTHRRQHGRGAGGGCRPPFPDHRSPHTPGRGKEPRDGAALGGQGRPRDAAAAAAEPRGAPRSPAERLARPAPPPPPPKAVGCGMQPSPTPPRGRLRGLLRFGVSPKRRSPPRRAAAGRGTHTHTYEEGAPAPFSPAL